MSSFRTFYECFLSHGMKKILKFSQQILKLKPPSTVRSRGFAGLQTQFHSMIRHLQASPKKKFEKYPLVN